MASPELPARCCCSDWIAGLARDHAGRLAAIARREGLTASDALDVVQDAFHTLLGRPDSAALRGQPDDAARLLAAIVRNAARNLRRRHHRARPHVGLDAEPALAEQFGVRAMPTVVLLRDGREVGRVVGSRPRAFVAGMLDRALAGDAAIAGP